MTLQADATLGTIYLDPEQFLLGSQVYGITQALPANSEDLRASLMMVLAAASRWVDAKTNKTFDPSLDRVEQHKWNSVTRRIYINNPPILSISDYRIYTGASTYSTFPVSAILINNQEKWVELSALSSVGNLTSTLLTIGLYEPIVQITYKSSADIKPNIIMATGFVAAAMLNRNYAIANSVAGNIKSIKIGSQAEVTAGGKLFNEIDLHIPDVVSLLLSGDQAIGIA